MRLLTPRRVPRRALLAGLALAVTAPLAGLSSMPASAADPIPFPVVGTADVFDSFLVQTVLKPGFEKAYPQYRLDYTSQGTGAAIATAKTGSQAAMIVHAASLENQFVADGFSAEPYGRSVFWGDFILAGPADDPAGVLNGSRTDIVGAYQKIAALGEGGGADVTRGGTPGTTVQEHAIWALTQGVDTCIVPASAGGGERPSDTNVGQACPTLGNGGADEQTGRPSWYGVGGGSQAANVQRAEACSPATYTSGKCYVFTDRGTFNYLESTGAVRNLKVLTRGGTVPGQENLLVNSFHAYAVNPAKFAGVAGQKTDLTAATLFLDWMTSPAGQQAVGDYLNATGDRPFIPSAAPAVTASPLPKRVRSGKRITVTGTVSNVTPGTPKLDGVLVKLLARPATQSVAVPQLVALASTDAVGGYTLKYKPKSSMVYSVSTDQITKVEVPTLSPVFADLLSPATAPLSAVRLRSRLAKLNATQVGRRLRLSGKFAPSVAGKKARVKVFAARPGQQKLRLVANEKIKNRAKRFAVLTAPLPGGVTRYRVKYVNKGVVQTAKTPVKRVTIR